MDGTLGNQSTKDSILRVVTPLHHQIKPADLRTPLSNGLICYDLTQDQPLWYSFSGHMSESHPIKKANSR
ncbi:hypothetical protein CIW50_06490 [Tardiphaga sp. P9-11]|nr:hypothetical protein CIW50_06490 [Tardiphaga sp. P9-11]